ncbi:MAG: hypothetical protein E7410_01580 [Ruminococcaceae bacterium]|nr:hypothetical protein [Oscillospiraceae bacterium]
MKNKMKKPITLMLALAMLVSVFGAYAVTETAVQAAPKYPQYTTEYGSVMIEAEKIVLDDSVFATEIVKEASGRKHVRVLAADTVQPAEDAPGMLGFELTFDQEGKHYIWARYIACGGGEDSFWLDCGNSVSVTGKSGYSSVAFSPYAPDATTYVWKLIATMPAVEAGDKQTVRIRNRERNLVIDKLVITKHMSFTPEGTGKLPDPETIGKPAKLPEDRYAIPSITPPPEHPRVLFRAKDIPQIKGNMQHPENALLFETFNKIKDKAYTGELTAADPNYDAEGLETILAKALDYAIYGNEENGREAISAIKNYAASLQVNSLGDSTRNKGHVIKVIGQVYDWCHPLLTDDDKNDLLLLCQSVSSNMEVGFPPDAQTILCGHGAEYQIYRDWFTMAIACYDEFPDVYNMIGGKVFSPESVEYRNWWNQSGTHSQGTSYGPGIRYISELYAHILVKRMSGKELFNEDDLTKIAYEWIYRIRPDGLLMIDGDDTSTNSSIVKGTYTTALKNAVFLASALNRDPILKKEVYYQGGITPGYGLNLTVIDMLLINDPSVGTNASTSLLPLTRYYSSPVGEMTARTGWDIGVKSDDVVATMTISEYNPMNHGHYECGHFMIYYKGILANDSGWYEVHGSDHHKSYNSQSVAHNTLVIETDYNKWGNQNQGLDGPGVTNVDGSGSKNFYWIPGSWKEYQTDERNHWADVLGHEFGPDIQYPEYSYLAGDITNAYTSSYDDGVNEALRHMIFMPTGDEKNPAAFIVFDKIDTKEGGKKKAFMLHSEEEPEVNGNITTLKRTERDYNGKLVNQTLLPSGDNLVIEKIGGVELDANGKVIQETDKRFWNKNQNWFFLQDCGKAVGANSNRTVNPDNSLEAGWGRVEIMPKKSGKVDYMLNVMYVGDADDNSAVKKAMLIETDSVAGAKIFDRVAVFNKSKQRIKDSVKFTIPGSETALKVNVAGLLAGTWSISVNGKEIGTQIASEDGGIIYFTAPAGSVTLTYVSADAKKTFTKSEPPVVEGVTLYADSEFIYSDVPPTIRDGRTLIPMRALLEAMDATVTWDEASATATATSKDGVIIKITENQKTAYVNGEANELDVPAMIIDGRFVIPVRFIAENFGCKVVWNERAQRVEITSPVTQNGLGIENVIGILETTQSGSEPSPVRQIASSCDGSFGTYWGVSSASGVEAWGIYDFGRVRAVDKVMFSFMSGNARKYKFDIEVSEDGTNYTPVLTGMETSGTKPVGQFDEFDLGGVKARYVKYKGYGNNTNMWNSLAEIVFTEKK